MSNELKSTSKRKNTPRLLHAVVRGTSYHKKMIGRAGTSRFSLKRLQMICVAMAKAPHGVTARQISELPGMEVNRKTIYRDIELLRRLGVEIDSQNDGWPIAGYALHHSKCPFCNHETLNRIKPSAPNKD